MMSPENSNYRKEMFARVVGHWFPNIDNSDQIRDMTLAEQRTTQGYCIVKTFFLIIPSCFYWICVLKDMHIFREVYRKN